MQLYQVLIDALSRFYKVYI